MKHETDKSDNVVITDSSENKKDAIEKGKRIWRLVLALVPLIPLAGLIAGFFYHRSEIKRYKEQLIPEINCYYKYFTASEEYKFFIKNAGEIDCKNIWVKEKIYAIIDGKVYEGDGVPHFNYFFYNGSRNRMWDLERGKELEVPLAELQIKAFHTLKEKFNSTIISGWEFTYSKEHSSKRHYNQHIGKKLCQRGSFYL